MLGSICVFAQEKSTWFSPFTSGTIRSSSTSVALALIELDLDALAHRQRDQLDAGLGRAGARNTVEMPAAATAPASNNGLDANHLRIVRSRRIERLNAEDSVRLEFACCEMRRSRRGCGFGRI